MKDKEAEVLHDVFMREREREREMLVLMMIYQLVTHSTCMDVINASDTWHSSNNTVFTHLQFVSMERTGQL